MSNTGRDDLHSANTPGHPASKIRHPSGSYASEKPSAPRPSAPQTNDDPLPVAKALGVSKGSMITFGKEKSHEEQWSRTPNTTGGGAIHVKTFNCKLTDDALA